MNGGIDKNEDEFPKYSNVSNELMRELKDQNKELKKLESTLFKAFNAPSQFRLRLIKWLFPEIIGVAKILKDFYWK